MVVLKEGNRAKPYHGSPRRVAISSGLRGPFPIARVFGHSTEQMWLDHHVSSRDVSLPGREAEVYGCHVWGSPLPGVTGSSIRDDQAGMAPDGDHVVT